MAGLKKINDFQYDNPIIDEPVMVPEQEPIKVQKPNHLPQSSKRNLKNISFLEKIIGFLLLVAIIGIAILTIQVRTSITQTSNEITKTQASITEKEKTTLKLEQQKTELSKTDRIKETAKNKGLSDNIDNTRKVK